MPNVVPMKCLQATPCSNATFRAVVARPRALPSSASTLPRGLPQSGPHFSSRSTVVLTRVGATTGATDDVDPEEKAELDDFRAALAGTVGAEALREEAGVEDMMGQPMTGEELRALVEARWGRAYDTRIAQRSNKIRQKRLYLQVMWKFLGQKSFPLNEQQYMDQLEAVAELLTEWGCADQIRREIPASKKNPVLDTTGANAVAFLLDVEY